MGPRHPEGEQDAIAVAPAWRHANLREDEDQGNSVAVDIKSRAGRRGKEHRRTGRQSDPSDKRSDRTISKSTRRCRSSSPGGEDSRRQCWLYWRTVCAQMKPTSIVFFPRCRGPLSDSTADCSSEHIHASDIKEFPSLTSTIRKKKNEEFWDNDEGPGRADDSYVCTEAKASQRDWLHDQMGHDGRARLAETCGSRGESPSSKIDLMKQDEAFRADGMEPTCRERPSRQRSARPGRNGSTSQSAQLRSAAAGREVHADHVVPTQRRKLRESESTRTRRTGVSLRQASAGTPGNRGKNLRQCRKATA